MNFKTTITTVVASMALSCSLFASPIMSPSKCPSVQSIKSSDFISAELIEKNSYFLMQQSNYDTEQTWEFGFGPIVADNEQEALEKGKAKINFLQGDLELVKYEDIWYCLYLAIDGKDLAAGVAAYQEGSDVTPVKLKSILKSKS